LIFRLNDVYLKYPRSDVAVISNLSLQIGEGEFVGIVGPTASGKSSLLKILSGVIPHFEPALLQGEVQIFGRPPGDWTLARLGERVGLVMEDPEDQLFNLRVRDEVTWALENRGFPKEEIYRRAADALRFFGIEHLAGRVTFDLSGGEKQRLALASIYASGPDALLLDKPTSELDPEGADQVRDAIRRLRAEQKTVVIVEDNIDFLISCCTRMLLLDRGCIRIDAEPAEFVIQLSMVKGVAVRNADVVEAAIRLNLDPLHFVRLLEGP
jgi:energy-coupling factor transporter ATP-binding protein EcfA2